MGMARSPDGANYGWVGGEGSGIGLGLLDCSAAVHEVDGKKWVTLAVVNVCEKKDLQTEVMVGGGDGVVGGGKEVEVYTVAGRDVWVDNCQGEEEVGIKESTWDGKGKYNFPRASLTMLRWAV